MSPKNEPQKVPRWNCTEHHYEKTGKELHPMENEICQKGMPIKDQDCVLWLQNGQWQDRRRTSSTDRSSCIESFLTWNSSADFGCIIFFPWRYLLANHKFWLQGRSVRLYMKQLRDKPHRVWQVEEAPKANEVSSPSTVYIWLGIRFNFEECCQCNISSLGRQACSPSRSFCDGHIHGSGCAVRSGGWSFLIWGIR